MVEKNIKYKQLCRIQAFGDDNIFNKAQYQYNASGSGVNNSWSWRSHAQEKPPDPRFGAGRCMVPSHGKYMIDT